MKIEILADADAVAQRRRFVMAVRGHTPWQTLRALANRVPWESAHAVQVDECVAPAGDADRNLAHLFSGSRRWC
ncbi:MAG: hypothetical protein ACM3TN_00450 [Alphaproteobacteria bacterium]